jgi:hypothetical protein
VPYIEIFRVVRILQQHLFVSEKNRSRVCDPWLELQDLLLFRGVLLDISGNLWSRADQAHFALQDIPELGQLIHLRLPEHSANPGNARIPITRHQRASPVSPWHHGPEFPDLERLPVQTNAPLAVENGATTRKFDERRNHEE